MVFEKMGLIWSASKSRPESRAEFRRWVWIRVCMYTFLWGMGLNFRHLLRTILVSFFGRHLVAIFRQERGCYLIKVS